jgi:hypothetical protein
MPRTRLDVIEAAFRHLGIKAEDQGLSADEQAWANAALEGIYAELEGETAVPFLLDTVDDAAFPALSRLLATEIGQSYGVPTETRGRAFMRLLAVIRPDNRPEPDPPLAPVYY